MLKATGIVRKMDELGRLVVPKEIRRAYNINAGDPVEIFVDGGKVVLRKYEPFCMFCSNTEGVIAYKGKSVCESCLSELKEL